MKIGIVLGGGGVRGAAHIGVLKGLQALGIKPDALAGTSSGGIVAALYACGCDVHEIEALARSMTRPAAIGIRVPLRRSRPGLLDLVRGYVEGRLFEDLPVSLSLSAFNLNTGEEIIFRQGPVLPAIRSTIALPGVFPPARSPSGHLLIDGAVFSPLPVVAVEGVGRIIAVDIRQGRSNGEPPHPWRRGRWVRAQVYRALLDRVADICLQDADVVITPDVQNVGTLDFRSIARCIDAGVKAVEARADEIQRLTTDLDHD